VALKENRDAGEELAKKLRHEQRVKSCVEDELAAAKEKLRKAGFWRRMFKRW